MKGAQNNKEKKKKELGKIENSYEELPRVGFQGYVEGLIDGRA